MADVRDGAELAYRVQFVQGRFTPRVAHHEWLVVADDVLAERVREGDVGFSRHRWTEPVVTDDVQPVAVDQRHEPDRRYHGTCGELHEPVDRRARRRKQPPDALDS